jgi:type IX secretion system PorP/SprF family membrane protein
MRKFLRNKTTSFLTAILFLVCYTAAQAQDVHFSQFAYAPLQVNPALTGIFDGKARISNMYRSQWSGIGKGFKTIYLSADAPLGREKMKNNYFGIGGMIYQDKAGEAGFKSTILEASLSYTTALTDQADHFFALGFQAGLNQQSIDLTKSTWDNQWNGDVYDPALPSGESIQLPQFSYLDFNAGVLYYYIPDGYNSLDIGASLSHIGSPNVSFFSLTEAPLTRKITVHSSGEINLGRENDSWVLPKLLVMFQGKQKEILAGGLFKRKLQFKSVYTNYRKEAYFSGGAFYRWKDSFIVMARFEFNTVALGLSYDVNNSSLSNLAGSSNAFEVNFTFVSYVKRGNRSKNVNRMPRFF